MVSLLFQEIIATHLRSDPAGGAFVRPIASVQVVAHLALVQAVYFRSIDYEMRRLVFLGFEDSNLRIPRV
jgi:hypothetical protein